MVIYKLLGEGTGIFDIWDPGDSKGQGDPQSVKVRSYVYSTVNNLQEDKQEFQVCVLQHKLDPYFA